MTFLRLIPAALALALLALPAGGLSAQVQDATDPNITVVGTPPSDLSLLPEGPEVKGTIVARSGITSSSSSSPRPSATMPSVKPSMRRDTGLADTKRRNGKAH